MNLFGHGQWYNGELNPNQFATDQNGRLAQTQQQQGLSDAFNGAEMGLNQVQPSNGPLNQTKQTLLGGILPSLTPLGKIGVGVLCLAIAGAAYRRMRK